MSNHRNGETRGMATSAEQTASLLGAPHTPWRVEWIGTAHAIFDADGQYLGGFLSEEVAQAAVDAVNATALTAGEGVTTATRRAAAVALRRWYEFDEACAAQGIPMNVNRPYQPLTKEQRELLAERDQAWRDFAALRDAWARMVGKLGGR
jgi:hypothetical protein